MDSGIIGVLGTVLGVLIGGPITYYYAKILIQETHKSSLDIMQRQEFNKAAAIFRAAFLPDLIYLKHDARVEGAGSIDGLNVFLSHGYLNRHLKAFEIFNAYLSPKEREGINKAWQEYCHYDIERETSPHWAMYAEKTWEGKDTKELALERIEGILKFAKHK